MKVRSLSCLHLAVPFKGVFEHSQKKRSYSDTLYVGLTTEDGLEGWGEVLARPYVTGETYEHILARSAETMAERLIGLSFDNQQQLFDWISRAQHECADDIALFGGVELALWSLLSQSRGVDLKALLGPVRSRSPGHCVTIGFDASLDDLRGRIIHARLMKATAVKLKVGLDIDADLARLQRLADLLPDNMQLRLDGNGTLALDAAQALCAECRILGVHSFEQPLAAEHADLSDVLQALYQEFSVPLMADESVCTQSQAAHWIASGAYQHVNVRVGKHGGLVASVQIRDLALASGLGIVGGSMVGESGILTQASTLLLQHSNAMDYMEGLGQNRSWLAEDPVERLDADIKSQSTGAYRFKEDTCERFLQSRVSYS